ncbi:MAG: TIGR04282 family arsenosugar biosynthesis glycosyltransferase [Proteobacteria bacterium]|nr:TIGR04282 family arsenosugar biosynthesis glycosyltransferase [Pseudomonadota bacterium]MBU1640584.1 TIGR04282 family arsenosugar biosynthesis glycosyltransferase [Pseudomonadota bacterium]
MNVGFDYQPDFPSHLIRDECTVPIPQDKVKTAIKEQELCIIFSRYPRPGASKTRLIPYLGAEGAADLQRRMTEKVVAEAARLANQAQVHVELAMAGATQDEMEAWLGGEFSWRRQEGTDLGERMDFAFAQAFNQGVQRVVLVGADCPSICTAILAQAFAQLHHHELVLGPTSDGGYYLIGLSRPCPFLFTGISWGSDQVLAQTMAAAREARLQPMLLESFSDVDRPEDLDVLTLKLLGAQS